jgi:secreted trypsin-like serine protease
VKSQIVLSAVFFASCSTQERTSKVLIAGGSPITEPTKGNGISRQTVALAKNADFTSPVTNQRSSFCTAVVLKKNLLLTAAHCAGKPEQSLYFAVFGDDMKSAKLSYPNSVRQVIKAVKHPSYPDKMVPGPFGDLILENKYEKAPEKWFADNPGVPPNDLAILKLNFEVPADYLEVSLANETDVAQSATLAGFGITRSSNVGDTGVLRFVQGIKVFAQDSNDLSRSQIGIGETTSVTELAKGTLAKTACPGDSGGPAFVENSNDLRLLGILSLGESAKMDDNASFAYCGGHAANETPKISNIYTDVRAYKDWIQKTVSELN